MERLSHGHSILLGMAIDQSTASTYSFTLNLYLTFCKIHDISVNATPETLSYYVAFQSSFINPKSVDSYLSSICNQLEPFYPHVGKNCLSALVNCTLIGTKWHYGVTTVRKAPLSVTNLFHITNALATSHVHDDLLFKAQLIMGFTGLLCLGDLMFPDNMASCNYRKLTLCTPLEWMANAFTFWLPTCKSDTTFEGNCVIVKKIIGAPDPFPLSYITSCDHLFPLHAESWLLENALVLTWSWFIRCLWVFPPTWHCRPVLMHWWRYCSCWSQCSPLSWSKVQAIGLLLPLSTMYKKSCGPACSYSHTHLTLQCITCVILYLHIFLTCITTMRWSLPSIFVLCMFHIAFISFIPFLTLAFSSTKKNKK